MKQQDEQTVPGRDKWGRELVPCKWCSTPTAMLGTRMCDGCWELERRISRDPELSRRILNSIQQESQHE